MASTASVQRASRNSNNKYAALKPSTATSGSTSPTSPAEAATSEAKCAATEPEQTERIVFARSSSSSSDADREEHGYVLLHLIRVLALYLYVYLSQNPFLVDDLLLQPGTELLEQASKLEVELHAMLLAYVQNEIASNQFDGLVQEKHVFFAIKKIFRLQKVKAVTQCKTLMALLATYLSLLQASPIVHCEPFSMLISTLEYLSKENKKDVSLPLLYPIVNAIDSLSIEQRECLDALTTLWKWLAACDPSELTLTKFVNRHHSVIIQIEDASSPKEPRQRSGTAATLAELGACFVRTLLRHSDHIFRHDPEYSDLQTSLESDTEDDESAEDACEPPVQQTPPPHPATTTTTTPKLPLLNATEVEVAAPVVDAKSTGNNSGSPSKIKGVSKSMRRRKKKGDEKQLIQVVKQQLQTKKEEALDGNNNSQQAAGNDENPEDESLPAVLCVTIAAAAGTIAAALCVIFT